MRFAPMLLTMLLSAQVGLAAEPAVVLEDPRGDDDGAGGLSYPTGSEYRAGDFDLRRVEISVDGEDALIAVTLGARIQKPAMVRRSMATEVELTNGIYVQNVDLYFDSAPGAGYTASLPGRSVAFEPEGAWDAAVVLTPQPFLTRSVLDDALPKGAADHVYVATDLHAQGPTLHARVPLAALGGVPQRTWGYAVLVTGASWDTSFAAVDRLVGRYAPNAFTLPVYAVPEPHAFGGGTLERLQPRVIDLFAPEGAAQRDILSGFSDERGRPAVVPMVHLDAPRGARSKPAATLALGLPVRTSSGAVVHPQEPVYLLGDVEGNKAVVALAPGHAVALWRLGTVLDERGEPVARVVVTAVFPGFVMATAVEGERGLRRGLRVRFAAAEATP